MQLALRAGAIVLATVGAAEKRTFLTERYGIPAEHIFSSRGKSFAGAVRRVTKRQGVDVVLNSLGGEGFLTSLECLAPYGRFVELGKKDMQEQSALPILALTKSATFCAVEVSQLTRDRPGVVAEALASAVKLVEEG